MKQIKLYNAYKDARDTRGISRALPGYLLVVWISYLLLSPFYVFYSGMPQPADMVLVLGLFPMVILSALLPDPKLDSAYLLGGAFAILTFVVNLTYYAFTLDTLFLLSSAFYIFNFLAFCFVIFLFRRAPYTMNQATYICVAIITVMQFLYVLFLDSSGPRHTGTFNNPNQLAYWSLLMACILIVLKRSSSLNLFDMALFSMLAFVQAEALSKAGLITFGLVVVFMAFSPVANKRLKALFMLGLAALIITKVTAPGEISILITNADSIEAVSNRLSKIGDDRDDSARVRGYSRLIDYPQYLIAGAGEGAHYRFNARQELHSGIATILFSYGIIGFTLFFTFLAMVFRRLPIYYGALLIPIILYGLTHQNFRNTGFWVFLALSYSYAFFKPAQRESQNRELDHRLDFFINKG